MKNTRHSFALPYLLSGSTGASLGVAILLVFALAGVGCDSTKSTAEKESATSQPSESSKADDEGAAKASDKAEKADKAKEEEPGGPVVEEGPLKVQIPSGFPKPERKNQPVQTVVGTVEGTMFQSMGPDGMAMIMYNEYPPEVFDRQTVETMLNGARDGAVNNVGAELVSQKPIRKGDHPMKSFIAKKSMGGQTFYFRMEMHVVRPHFVQLQFASQDKSRLDDADANAYFDSLELEATVKKEGEGKDGDKAGEKAAE